MNICMLSGKIISEIEFKFIINSKDKAIVYFDLELANKSIVKVEAYNEMADYCYKQLKKDDEILIYGKLDEKGRIKIIEIEKWECDFIESIRLINTANSFIKNFE